MKPSSWVHIAGAAITGASLVVWYSTGAEGYTRWPNERLARADAPPAAGESELLAEAGFADDPKAAPLPDIQSRFALGLVPGGADPRHLISVASAAGATLIASGTVVGLRLCRASRPASRIAQGDLR